jgi:uncharacterized protein (DUF983 family)
MHGHYRQYHASTIKVPVYASWKCEKCAEVNFATGRIVYRQTESTTSWGPSQIRAARERVSARTNSEWVTIAAKIIFDPNRNGSAMYKHFFLQNCKCTKCGKKPRWGKTSNFNPFLALLIPSYITTGIIAFSMLPTVAAWLFLLANIGVVAWAIVRKVAYPKKMAQLSKAYTPVIGSFNPSLVKVAVEVGKTMPTPDECMFYIGDHNKTGNT